MKKIILIAGSLFSASIGLMAQSSLLVTKFTHSTVGVPATTVTLTQGSVIYRTVAAGGSDGGVGGPGIELNFKNISNGTKSYKIKRFDDVVNTVNASDLGYASFCFAGNCFPSDIKDAPTAVLLKANEDALGIGQVTSVHYDEASVVGLSTIRYHIYEVSNPSSDYFEFTVKYNDPSASIKTNSSLFSNVSSVFPSPSNSKAFININAIYDVSNVSVSITNALGAIVSIKNVDLSVGKNTIDLDSQNLGNGLYFVTISTNNSKITKKFTINK